MPIAPKISSAMQREHQGQTAISFNGKVIAFGKNAIAALKKAKKFVKDIEEKDFVISRVHGRYLEA